MSYPTNPFKDTNFLQFSQGIFTNKDEYQVPGPPEAVDLLQLSGPPLLFLDGSAILLLGPG